MSTSIRASTTSGGMRGGEEGSTPGAGPTAASSRSSSVSSSSSSLARQFPVPSQRRTPSASPRIHASPSAAAAAGRSWPVGAPRSGSRIAAVEEDRLDLGPSSVRGGGMAAAAAAGYGSSLVSVQPISPAESLAMVQTIPTTHAGNGAAAAAAAASGFTIRRPSALHTSGASTDDSFPTHPPLAIQTQAPASRARLASTVLAAAAAPFPAAPAHAQSASSSLPLGYASAALVLLQSAPSHDAADLHSTPEPQSASARLQSSPRGGGGGGGPWSSSHLSVDVSVSLPRSGSASRLLGHQHSMLPPSSAVAAAAAHPSGAPQLKERSHSSLLPSTHSDEVRSVFCAPPSELHDAYGVSGGGSRTTSNGHVSHSFPVAGSSTPSSSPPGPPPFDLSDLRRFVHTPLPRDGQQLRCTLYRDRTGSRFHPRFVLCTEVEDDTPDEEEPRTPSMPPSRASPSGSPNRSPRLSASLRSSPHHHSRKSSPMHEFPLHALPASASASASVPGPTRPRVKRMRVLMYAQKASSSRYHFRVADAADLPPSEALLMREAMAAAAVSTPTLSPLLLPQTSAPCAPSDAPTGRIKDDAECVGVMQSNFIGNKFAFHCKGQTALALAAAGGGGGGGGAGSSSSATSSAGSSSSTSPVVAASVQTWSGSPPPSLCPPQSLRPASATAATDATAVSPRKQMPLLPSPFLASLGGAQLSAFGSTGAVSVSGSSYPVASPCVSVGGAALLSSMSTSGDVAIEYELNLFTRTPRPRHMVVQIPPLRTSAADFLANHAAALAVAAPQKQQSQLQLQLQPASPASKGRLGRKSSSVSGVSAAAPLVLHTNQPRWNSQRNCHMLNFGGRAPVPSLKNFQLIGANHEHAESAAGAGAGAGATSPTAAAAAVSSSSSSLVVLQLGKVAAHQFNVDVRFPLTPLQAFAIVLSAFDYKLAVD